MIKIIDFFVKIINFISKYWKLAVGVLGGLGIIAIIIKLINGQTDPTIPPVDVDEEKERIAAEEALKLKKAREEADRQKAELDAMDTEALNSLLDYPEQERIRIIKEKAIAKAQYAAVDYSIPQPPAPKQD